jgi:phospholipase/carboxylesterase
MMPTRLEIAGLTTWIVDRPDASVTCVLLHGFGAPGDDLISLADEIVHESDAPVRLVFPAAPLSLGGMYGDSRAWWMLDLARLNDELRRGVPRDRRDEIPEGFVEARDRVMQLVDQLAERFAIAPDRLVLGGFSQGAMVSLDVALHRAVPPAGLILMSGTLIAEAAWQPRMARLAGVPVMMSHGRDDVVLPFQVAEILRDRLVAAGAAVDWRPFSGGQGIPPVVIQGARELLRNLAAR